MNIQLATQQYDDWLRSVCTVYEPDIDEKHRVMAKKDPFPFFRATYYRWLQRWPEVCAHLQDAGEPGGTKSEDQRVPAPHQRWTVWQVAGEQRGLEHQPRTLLGYATAVLEI